MKNILNPDNNKFIPWGNVITLNLLSFILGVSLPDFYNIINNFIDNIMYSLFFVILYIAMYSSILYSIHDWDRYLSSTYRHKQNIHINFSAKLNKKISDETAKTILTHIDEVIGLMRHIINLISDRADSHDESLLDDPEFTELTKEKVTCNSLNEELIRRTKEVAKHHYSINPHHPEYFGGDFSKMNFIDIIEYLCNIKATTLHDDTTDIFHLINRSSEMFKYSDDLKNIMINTAKLLYKYTIIYSDKSKNYSKEYYGDSMSEIENSILDDDNISEMDKYYIKFGPHDEFLNHIYRSVKSKSRDNLKSYEYIVRDFSIS